MPIKFKAKTTEGYTIKIMSELLKNIIKTACLEIHNDGIYMRMMDSQRRILVDICLHADKFSIFEKPTTEVVYLGINLSNFHRFLKSVKKKDTLTLQVNTEHPDQLYIIVQTKEQNRVSKSNIHIYSVQNVDIPLPEGYGNPVIIPSNEYQRSLKDMKDLSDTITVKMHKYSARFLFSSDNLYGREVLFGELDDTTEEMYSDTFEMEQFSNTLKLTGLSSNIQVYGGNGSSVPLKLQSDIGFLGTISIYIKSKVQTKTSS